MDRLFEYQVFNHGRWITMQAFQDENAAIDTAQACIQDMRHDRVRVLSVRPANEATTISRVIFHKEIEIVARDVKLGELFERPAICHDIDDLYKPNARLTLNRLLAEYCQRQSTTVTEILYNRIQFRQLCHNEELVEHALEQVGRLQWTEQQSAAERINDLQALMQQVKSRLDCLAGSGRASIALEKLIEIAQNCANDDADARFRLGVLWADLMASRTTPLSKLGITLETSTHFNDCCPVGILHLRDLQLADLLYNTDLQDQLFGPIGARGERIYLLLALAEGVIGDMGLKPRPIGQDVHEYLQALKKMFAAGALPHSRAHLLSLATAYLNQPEPLDIRDQNSNHGLFRQLLELSGRCPRLLDDQRLVLALTKRVSRHANVHSGNLLVEARHAGILMKNPAMAILYWTRLHEHTRNHDLKRGLAQRIYEMVDTHQQMEELIPGRWSIEQRMRQMTECYTAITQSSIEDKVKMPVLARLDLVLLDYTRTTKMLEKINDQTLGLRDRAFRLVRFCSSGLLPEGPVLLQIRQSVLDMLRRPHFHHDIIADLNDPGQISIIQRQFYDALQQAGFTS